MWRLRAGPRRRACDPVAFVIEIRPVHADRPPADALLAEMVAEITRLYGPLEDRGAPSATPAELWAPGGTYLVVSEDGEPVAGGGVKRIGEGVGEVKRMFVRERARGRGHARRLLFALEDAARGLGHTRLRLDTGPRQPHARALYASAGYVEIPDYNDNRVATYWGEKRLALCEVWPRADPVLAERITAIQRAAYAVEAAVIGFDGIPALHETVADVAASEDRWLGRYAGAELVGALAWQVDGSVGPEITRLVVLPEAFRRGHASALLDELLARAGDAPVRVLTGAANGPALALYARRGFAAERDEEVAPGIAIRRLLRRPPG